MTVIQACRPSRYILPLLLAFLTFVTGCKEVATTAWSPDGQLAAYASQGQGHLFDKEGKVLTTLGETLGAFAWSADSKTLFHARSKMTVDDEPLYPAQTSWLPNPDHPRPVADPTADRNLVGRWTDGKDEELFDVVGNVLLLRVSPDGAFLAATVATEQGNEPFAVYVYSIAGKRLYLLDDAAGLPITFTADSKLLYLSADWEDGTPSSTGKVVEVALAPEVDATPVRNPLVNVLMKRAIWLERAGSTILFTSTKQTFPGSPSEDADKHDLYTFTPADGKLVSIADDVGPLFTISPDGKLVLFQRSWTDKGKRAVIVMNVNGSDAQVLREMPEGFDAPALPAWRSNEEISWSSPDPTANDKNADGTPRRLYDLVLYRLVDGKMLDPVRTLSTTWTNDQRPRTK